MMYGSIWNSKILIRISEISAKSERTVKVGSLFHVLRKRRESCIIKRQTREINGEWNRADKEDKIESLRKGNGDKSL